MLSHLLRLAAFIIAATRHRAAVWLQLVTLFIALYPACCLGTSYSSIAEGQRNLWEIGKATIIYASDHQERFPQASDVWDYARILAEDAGLDDARFWQSHIDPANTLTADKKLTVLSPAKKDQPRLLDPKFQEVKPSFAVALGKLRLSHPSTTPIAWTRGLQPDGTWAAHSPYGTRGGHIFFVGGNVQFFTNLADDGGQLIRADGIKTANILEALPPGTRISEYVPTPAEQEQWAKAERPHPIHQHSQNALSNFLIPIIFLWSPFLAISAYRQIKHKTGVFSILVWPVLLTLLFLAIVPTVAS